MPPKSIPSVPYTTRKLLQLNQSLISDKKSISYNEDLEMQRLKNYIDARTTPKKKAAHRKSTKKSKAIKSKE